MNWIKKISKILISLFIIVNSAISFNYEPVFEEKIELNNTELLVAKENVSSGIIGFKIAQYLLFSNFEKIDRNIPHKAIQTLAFGNNYQLELNIQNTNLLKYKSTLLKVVLNDIIQQKSHWM